MQSKRRAAADVFMEQNVMQQAEEAKELDDGLVLAVSKSAVPAAPPPLQAHSTVPPVPQGGLKTSEELQLEKEPIRVRETGFGPFKRVIVPPNVYVVHTRIGRRDPVTLGQGLSFRYNPNTDAYLVVPAAMQTIGIVANCISKEKQGINVLAYVQWQIQDFAVAYRKLDLSDLRDPLGIVNAQLREQAEAAIKDKIATMSVEEVLTDKEPVIEELTARLKAVAEGRNAGDRAENEGLGIKIVTVQIKEALVSSQRLWENLQAPFRYEKDKIARISFLSAQDEIRQRELQTRQAAETGEAETQVEIERIKQGKQTEALETRLAEENRRFTREQEAVRQKTQLEEQTRLLAMESDRKLRTESAKVEQALQLAALRRAQEEAVEQARLDAEAAARRKALQVEQALQELVAETRLDESRLQAEQGRIERQTALKQLESGLRLLEQEQNDRFQAQALEATLARTQQESMAKLELQEAYDRARLALAEKQAELDRLQQETRNLTNERDLSSRLIEKLPELAAHMPEIHELKVLQTGAGDGAFDALAGFLTRVLALAESLGLPPANGAGRTDAATREGEDQVEVA